MKIILLSGGSGKRLWPLSNESRSKQFLQLLTSPNGQMESMVQRIGRQINEANIEAQITIATSKTQYDAIINQLGAEVDIVTEPERRDTFPAIALSASYLIREKKTPLDEVVVVMPSDSYVDNSYFETIAQMAQVAQRDDIDMVLMGIKPCEPSTKFGYILPKSEIDQKVAMVKQFCEKPNQKRATELIAQGAVWNGGVFAFKLGYIANIIEEYIQAKSFSEIHSRYAELPKISFDYEVVERAKHIALVEYSGEWDDLGTWSTLAQKIQEPLQGRVLYDGKGENVHIINESELPIITLGCKDMIIAASPDGILVSNKAESVNLKSYADLLKSRPMYEERRWGSYKIMGMEQMSDGHKVLTKYLHIKCGCDISYQYHLNREEIWTVVDGEGLLAMNGEVTQISRGSVVHIRAGEKHAVKATQDMEIVEVQSGKELTEEDVVRFEWSWK